MVMLTPRRIGAPAETLEAVLALIQLLTHNVNGPEQVSKSRRRDPEVCEPAAVTSAPTRRS